MATDATGRFALACASHTPMLFDAELTDQATCDAVRASFDRMAGFIQDFAPQHVVQFSPDHFHGFHYDCMPSFCIGTAARSYGDWRTATGPLRVDERVALALLDAVRAADIDAAVSHDMVVDHGFVQIWEALFGRFDAAVVAPIVPIFVNCIAEPLPAYRRARLLGQAVGRFAAGLGQRVLFAASGGLSHDPVIPRIQGAGAELRARLLGRTPLTAEQQARREVQVRAAAVEALQGQGPSRPLSPAWDRDFIGLLERRDWAAFDAFTPGGVDAVAGAGGNEVLCWIAAAAALDAAAGGYRLVQQDYRAVDGWIAGMAHVTAR